MAATSPYSPNDYQAVDNFRPYNLPINDIFKAISAQNEFWDAGARRVKAVYDNALNLDLTLDANKEVKKKFMEDADKQLTKLSSMDLSDSSVQRQGFNIYKPLLQDKAIMYDSELTKTLKGVYGDANSYRKRKLSTTGREGEGYTDRNLAYSLDGFEQFHSKLARDPDQLKSLYDKLGNRKYTPYYDQTKEYAAVLKTCKGSGTTGQDVAKGNYMYFDMSSKTGANSSETANCFMMGLSEQAKNQIGIDGWAYYKGNPSLLANDHRDFVVGKQERQLSAIKGQIAGLKAGDQSKLTKEEKDYIAKVEKDVIPQMQVDYDDRVKEYTNMVGGDGVKYVTDNFQNLSRGIYLNKTYGYLGEAYKSDENIHKLTSNASGIAQFNAIEKSYQQQREHDYNMDEIRLRGTLARKLKQDAGEIPLDYVLPATPPVTEDPNAYGEKDFNREYEISKGQLDSANASLHGYIRSTNPDKTVPITDEYILNYVQEQSKRPVEQQDKQFVERMAVFNAAKDNFADLDMRKKTVNQVISNNFPELFTTTRKASDGTELTLDEVQRIKSGEVVKGIKQEMKYKPYSLGVDFRGADASEAYYTKDGTIISMAAPLAGLEQANEKQLAERNRLYAKSYFDSKGYLTPRINPEKMPAIDNIIKSTLDVMGGNNQKSGYRLLYTDRTGRDLIVVPLDEDGKEMSADLKRVTSAGVGATEEKIGTSITAVRIPNMMDILHDAPSLEQQTSIDRLRNFKSLMDVQMKNKGGYFSSEDLRNNDGSTFPYTNFTFKTEGGANIKVKAVSSNGTTQLVPAVQLPDGTWDTNYKSFNTPEDLVLYFRRKK